MKPDPPVGGPTPEIYSPRKARAHRGMSSLYIQTFTVRAERTGQNGHLKINQTNVNQDDSSMAVSTVSMASISIKTLKNTTRHRLLWNLFNALLHVLCSKADFV